MFFHFSSFPHIKLFLFGQKNNLFNFSMNERLQKNCFYSMTSQVRRAAKSDLKALCVVRNLFEKKRHTFTLFIKICLAEVRHN